MSATPPYEHSTGALKRLYEVEMGLDLIAAILGLDPKVWVRCQGDPEACGARCTEEGCPLQTNRLQNLGEMVATLLEEFRWHRAWAEELEDMGVVPGGTLDRVTLRVEKSRLQDRLKEAVKAHEALTGVQVLRERFVDRISEIRADIEAIDSKLGGDEGVTV